MSSYNERGVVNVAVPYTMKAMMLGWLLARPRGIDTKGF